MIQIYLNDEQHRIKPDQSLQDFLVHHQPAAMHYAIALNNQFIPRTAYQSTELREGDRINIVVPMQGG